MGRLPQCYAQTLVRLDRILRGWANAFSFCNGRQSFYTLDRNISKRINKFVGFAFSVEKDKFSKNYRRMLGVHLLSDTPLKDLKQGDRTHQRIN